MHYTTHTKTRIKRQSCLKNCLKYKSKLRRRVKRLQKVLILTPNTSASAVVGGLLSNVLQYSFFMDKYEILKLETFYKH